MIQPINSLLSRGNFSHKANINILSNIYIVHKRFSNNSANIDSIGNFLRLYQTDTVSYMIGYVIFGIEKMK